MESTEFPVGFCRTDHPAGRANCAQGAFGVNGIKVNLREAVIGYSRFPVGMQPHCRVKSPCRERLLSVGCVQKERPPPTC